MPTLETTSDVEHYYSEADDTGMHVPQLHFSNRDAMGKPVEQRMVNRFRRTAQIQNLKSRERSAITFETRIRRLASQKPSREKAEPARLGILASPRRVPRVALRSHHRGFGWTGRERVVERETLLQPAQEIFEPQDSSTKRDELLHVLLREVQLQRRDCDSRNADCKGAQRVEQCAALRCRERVVHRCEGVRIQPLAEVVLSEGADFRNHAAQLGGNSWWVQAPEDGIAGT